MIPLPIDSVIAEALAALARHKSLVLVAEPGAGKTTRVPPAILKTTGLLTPDHPNVVLLQPRRVAARAAAARIADENHWQLGREVGYHIRFERRVSRETRLHVMTEGVLTRRLLDDPILDDVGCVILDEFHERSLHTDMAAALLREVRETVRPDLMIVVMSATLEAEPVARFFQDCPIIRSAGRTFPVTISHDGATPRAELPRRIADIVANLDDPGDTLVFLPGVGEINRTIEALDPIAQRDDLLVVPLHGSLASDDQFAALRPSERRKVVVATNIAETSLTIDGVTTVIDSGLARVAGYDPLRGMDRLELKRISRASATQRAGRAGRTAPGRCIRLYSEGEERAMKDFDLPEVRRVDLCATVLTLHAWGHADPRTFGWYELPDERSLAGAERLLEMLGALTQEKEGKITDLGRRMLALPVHPRLARLLISAAESGMAEDGAAIAALLSEKDILRRPTDAHPRDRRPTVQAESDLIVRLDVLNSRGRGDEVDVGALRQVEKTRDELMRIAQRVSPSPRNREEGGEEERAGESAHSVDRKPSAPLPSALPGVPARGSRVAHDLLRLPLWAYPDRVCRRRVNDPSAAVMVGGGGVRLAPESAVRQPEFFVALEVRQDERNSSREAIAQIVSGIDVAWLEEDFPKEIRRDRAAVYDKQRDRVVGHGTVSYRDLLLREDKDAAVDDETASRVLGEWAREHAAAIVAADERVQRWIARLSLLRKAMPEKGWPTVSAAEVVETAVAGKRSLAQLRPAMGIMLSTLLQYPLDRLLDTEAPESILVPTGNHIRLEYPQQKANTDTIDPPVLAVRLQEMFGQTQTPRIAGGRVAVRLHLLGPNYRPVQITDDLKSFWMTTYFQVRKDLRVRYPKHSWPEDPLAAKPEAKGRRRPT